MPKKSKISAKTIGKAVKTYNRKRKATNQKRKVVSSLNKMHGKIPFTYRFDEMNPHHRHHHEKRHEDAGIPCLDLTTVLVPKTELSYCKKMARLIMTANLKGKRIAKSDYFRDLNGHISQLLVEKAYQKFILAENKEKLIEGGIISTKHHHSHQAGSSAGEDELKHDEHVEAEQLNKRFQMALLGTAGL